MPEPTDRQTQAVEQVRGLIKQYKGELVASLPSHLQEKGQGWMASALASVRRDPNLLQAVMESPSTFINALSQAAQLGLTPGTEQYYLTPRKVKGRWEVLGISGYQGEIELMYRAGAVDSVIVETVHENDKFQYVVGQHDRPIHEVDWFGSGGRGKIIGAYAYAIMKGGAISKVVMVNQARIDRAMDASPTAHSDYSPWKKDTVSMWLKTAAHDLAKWVPTSAEYIREKLRAEREVAAETTKEPAAPAAPPPGGVNPGTGEMEDLGERPAPPPEDEYTNEPNYPDGWGTPDDSAA